MFEHSIKVPRHYKIAANIFKKVSVEGGSVKTLLYDSKLRHFRTNVLYALITETIKHAVDLDKIFESASITKNEPRLDPWLAKILAAELLFGKKSLPGKSKPEQTILSYKEQFEKYTTEHRDDLKNEGVRRPRYVRINTNLLTTSDATRAFQDEGYRFVRCTSGSYDDYLNQIQNLSEDQFTQDYHVKTVYVFPAGTKLHEHQLYLEHKIILQDKATTLAVHLLAPPSGSTVLDMCAAPGMKTTQLAAYLRNEGKIYAVERNEGRYKTLCDFVEQTGSKCVETINKDVLDIKKNEYEDVEYILLDPSCSGSGMEFCVHNYIEEARLSKLTSLQEKFLKHAMNSFPNAKRIVYSTCSIYPEENERVVTNAVKTSRAKWRVQDVKEMLKGQWNNFGSGMYGTIGARCIYARPDSDLTTGFFLAVLDKEQRDATVEVEIKNNGNNTLESVQKNSSRKEKKKIPVQLQTDVLSEVVISKDNPDDIQKNEDENVGKKKKKKKGNVDSCDERGTHGINDNSTYTNTKHKKRKHQFVETTDSEQKSGPKKKKKKKAKSSDFNEENDDNVNSTDLVEEVTEECETPKEKRKNTKTKLSELCTKDKVITKSKKKEKLQD